MWLQLKRDAQKQRKTRRKMHQNLGTMPFDLWFEMKKTAQNEDADEPTEAELRRHYRNLGASRRAAMKHPPKAQVHGGVLNGRSIARRPYKASSARSSNSSRKDSGSSGDELLAD